MVSAAKLRKLTGNDQVNPSNARVTWQEVVYDTDSWADLANDELVVPAGLGITHVRILAQVRWDPATATNTTTVAIVDGDAATLTPSVADKRTVGFTTSHLQQVVSPLIPVSAGDRFEVLAAATQATIDSDFDQSSFSIEGYAVGTSPLTVQETDGDPVVSGVSVINVPPGSLTDEGGGSITLDFATGGSGGGGIGQIPSSGTVWSPFLAPASGTQYDDEFVAGVAVTGTLAQGGWSVWDEGGQASIIETHADGGGLRMSNFGNTSTGDIQFFGIYKDIPTESLWEAITYVSIGSTDTLSAGRSLRVGFGLFDDVAGNPGTTDFVFMGLLADSTGFSIVRETFDDWDDETPSNTDIITDGGDLMYPGVFLKISARDGNNDSFDLHYSFDGYGWGTFSWYPYPLPFDIDQIGIIANNANSSSLNNFTAKFFRIDPRFLGSGSRGIPILGNYIDPTGGGGGVEDPLTIGTINVTDSLTISGVPVPLEGGSGGGSTTASGGYFDPMAPPTYPSPFDDEFDQFTDDADGEAFTLDPDPVWTQWDPGGNLRMRNQYGEGVSEAGFGFSHVGNATPTWNGYIRPLADMAATTSGGQSYWFDVHVSMAERHDIRGLGGVIIGGDLISSPTTEKFIYVALENNASLGSENNSQYQIRWSTNGVDYNDAITTNSSTTDSSGPLQTDMHLRIMYDGLSNQYSALYSTDGRAFSIVTQPQIASGTLNFTPHVVGIVGRGEDVSGGWLTRFSHFRFRKGNNRDIEGGCYHPI
jgi:hypothetical protein